MPNWFTHLGAVLSAAETKAATTMVSVPPWAEASWSRRGFVSLANAGYVRNPVVHACVRKIAEAATSVPLLAVEGGRRLSEHPVLALLGRPNARQSGGELMESLFAFLMTAGNAYVAATVIEGEVRELHALRPDRVRVLAGRDGYPAAYVYTAGGKATELKLDTQPVAAMLHMGLFHPLDDHYGLAPMEAAAQALDIHNAAAEWNKALLDNAARPSGALIYSAGSGTLTESQFRRLKDELEQGFAGAKNAGRPLVLEGGLDWKAMALTPAEMDFAELKNAAARDIALAFGVEALGEDRAALWARVGAAGFLTDEEKRGLVGV